MLEKEDGLNHVRQVIALHKAPALSTRPEASPEQLVKAFQVSRTHAPLSQAQQVSDGLRQRREYEEKFFPEERSIAHAECINALGGNTSNPETGDNSHDSESAMWMDPQRSRALLG